MNAEFKELAESLPEWVRSYVLPATVGGLLALAAYSAYGWHRDSHNRAISLIYWQMDQAIGDESQDAASEAFALLQRDGSDVQVAFAAARLAGFQHDQGSYEQAAASYDTVIARSPFETMRDLARLRKVRALIAGGGDREEEVGTIIDSLESNHPSLLRTANILAGDVSAAAGDLDQARQLYASVMQGLTQERAEGEAEMIEIVRLKLAILDSERVIRLSRREGEPEAEGDTEPEPESETQTEDQTQASEES